MPDSLITALQHCGPAIGAVPRGILHALDGPPELLGEGVASCQVSVVHEILTTLAPTCFFPEAPWPSSRPNG